MKIVFMSTPEFGIPSLKKLFENNYKIAAVVSSPDKERGRGKKITPTPVKEFALQNNLDVLTPVSLKEESFIESLKKLEADLFIVVAFRILPKEVYTIPRLGSFNLHGSLLPKYRGAAPIQWSLINGVKETGLTTFFLEEKVDTGNIIMQKVMPIDDEDDFGSLYSKMMNAGADVVLETVKLIESGNVKLMKQDNSLATPAPKITKEICLIDWNKSAFEIHNLVRGLSPHPGAFFEHNNKIYKIYKTRIIEELTSNVISHSESDRFTQTKTELFVQTGNGLLQILEIQQEGRKRMNTEDFLRGYSII